MSAAKKPTPMPPQCVDAVIGLVNSVNPNSIGSTDYELNVDFLRICKKYLSPGFFSDMKPWIKSSACDAADAAAKRIAADEADAAAGEADAAAKRIAADEADAAARQKVADEADAAAKQKVADEADAAARQKVADDMADAAKQKAADDMADAAKQKAAAASNRSPPPVMRALTFAPSPAQARKVSRGPAPAATVQRVFAHILSVMTDSKDTSASSSAPPGFGAREEKKVCVLLSELFNAEVNLANYNNVPDNFQVSLPLEEPNRVSAVITKVALRVMNYAVEAKAANVIDSQVSKDTARNLMCNSDYREILGIFLTCAVEIPQCAAACSQVLDWLKICDATCKYQKAQIDKCTPQMLSDFAEYFKSLVVTVALMTRALHCLLVGHRDRWAESPFELAYMVSLMRKY